MRRREFLELSATTLALGACGARTTSRRATRDRTPACGAMDAAAFHAARRHADLAFGRIAYVERGVGPAAALFLHGAPLNGYQWRGALDRLAPHRRCIAPDFMGLGYSEIPASQSLAAPAQAAMLAALLDALAVREVDLVASDSGVAVAQLLVVRHPGRVRSLLFTNGDVEPDSPPAGVKPAIELARAGKLAEATAEWLVDRPMARATFGAAVYQDPATLSDETLETYAAPLVATPERRARYEAFHLALEPNPLAGIEDALRRCAAPMRLVWGTGDDIFAFADAEYLARTFPRARGIRRVAGGKLFFPEEQPDVIAEEALALWAHAAGRP
jgi:pimeloyl-ACP methyl ester carboxylesterase